MRAQRFSKGEAVRFGWETMKSNLGFFIGLLVVYWLISCVPNVIAYLTAEKIAIVSIIFSIGIQALYMILSMGLIRVALRFCDGEKPEYGDLFACYPLFFKYLFAYILYALIVVAGTILLIVPGIIWGIKYWFFAYFVVDKKLGPIEALKKSSEITKGIKWDLFIFGLLLAAIALLGMLCLLVGWFAAMPTTMVAGAFVYRKLTVPEWEVRMAHAPISRRSLVLALLICFCALISLPVLAHAGWNFALLLQVKAKLDQIAASGAPVSLEQVVPPPVPDEQNAALLYQKAFEAFQASGGKHQLDKVYTMLPSDRLEIPPARWAAAKRIVSRNQRTYALLKAASERSHCRFPVDWEKPQDALYDVSPHFLRMAACARFLRLRAVVKSQEGKVGEAVDSIKVGLRMADLSSEPGLIAALNQNLLIRTTLWGLPPILVKHRISPQSAQGLFADLHQTDLSESLARALEVERVLGIWGLDQAARGPKTALRAMGGVSKEIQDISKAMAWLYASYLGKSAQKTDKLLYLELMERRIAISRLPYRDAKPALEELKEDSTHFPALALMTRLGVSLYTSLDADMNDLMAEIGAVQIALALKAYQYKTGHYPASLQELRRLVPWDLPTDPFSGKDLGYRREGSGFILHSYGLDLDDDGGQIPKGKLFSSPGTKDSGDIVWRFGSG